MKDLKEVVDEKNKVDDSKELVTIDYYDRINKRIVKLEVTKEVARLVHSEKEKTRRGNNRYNRHNLSFDEVFDSTKKEDENEKYLLDESSDPQTILEEKELQQFKKALQEHQKTILENAMAQLTTDQQDVIRMVIYDNMSYSQIAKARGVSKPAVYKVMKAAEKNIKNYIQQTQN